jgi:hypothetical protein
MPLYRRTIILMVLLVTASGCTGESVKVVLPDRHPANPSAVEAPFVSPPDPFAGVPLPVVPSRPEEPRVHRHEHHPDPMDKEMRMDDMQMDDDKGNEMIHGGHGRAGASEEEERR